MSTGRQRFSVNLNTIQDEQDSFKTKNGEFYALTEGSHLLRILPPWSEAGKFYQKYGIHTPPRRGDISKKVVCMDFTFDQLGHCLICQEGEEVRLRDGKEAAKAYQYKKRAYLNVLDMKKADGKVQILDAPSTIINYILNFLAEEQSDELVDPNIGYNVAIRRYKGANGFTEYEVMVKPKIFDLEQQGYDVDNILGSLVDLERQVKTPSEQDVDTCLSLIQEGGSDDDQGAGQTTPQDEDTAFNAPAMGRGGARPPVRSPAAQAGDDPTPRTIRSAAPAQTRAPAGAARTAAPARQGAPQPTRQPAPAAGQARTAAPARGAAPTGNAQRAAPPRPAQTQAPRRSAIPAALEGEAMDPNDAPPAPQARRAPASTKVAVRAKPQPQPPPPVDEGYEEEQPLEGDAGEFGAGDFNDIPNFDDNGEEIPF